MHGFLGLAGLAAYFSMSATAYAAILNYFLNLFTVMYNLTLPTNVYTLLLRV